MDALCRPYTEEVFQSFRYSHMALRIGLAAVFLWFGIGKFMQSQYWIDTWMPGWFQQAVGAIGMSATNAIILIGIFEVLVATSLVTGFFQRWFAAAGALFLVTMIIVSGLNETVVRDVGLIGALLALAAWPERHYS